MKEKVLCGLPADFVERLRGLAPNSEEIIEILRADPDPAFWINPLLSGNDRVLEELRELEPKPLPWPPGAWTVAADRRSELARSAPAGDGRIYIQNASSQAAVAVLNPQPGEKILDLAAAPGGKTLRMATCPQTEIAAVEVSKPRFFRLKENLRRCGVSNVRLFLKDGRVVGSKTPERFDAVLLDAPCSSEAVMRVGQPETWKHWNLSRVKKSAGLQKELLWSAFQALKPGGRILYSTCSLSPEENESVIDAVMRKAGGNLLPEEIDVPIASAQAGLKEAFGAVWDERVQLGRRIYPDGVFSAFFLCLLRKST